MIATIQPKENFPITRIITDPLDTNTYYVRAKIRRASTQAVIESVNLTDQGNRIFSKVWQAPSDSSGQGLFITITTTVYTDSGYTSVSDVYPEISETFLVYDRFNFLATLAQQISALITTPSADIDYAKIRKIMREELAKLDLPEFDPSSIMESLHALARQLAAFSSVKTSLSELANGIGSLKKCMDDMPKFEKTDLTPVVGEIMKAHELISAIKIPEHIPTDLSPVLESIRSVSLGLPASLAMVSKSLMGLHEVEPVLISIEKSLKELALSSFYISEHKKSSEKKVPFPALNSGGKILNRKALL